MSSTAGRTSSREGKRTIGIVGGMSPESTAAYYLRIVHRHVEERGTHDYPRVVVVSVSFQNYIEWLRAGRWELIAEALEKELDSTAEAGADFALLATNTMHRALPMLEARLPLLSIFDAVSSACEKAGVRRVGLTGTRITMADSFYTGELVERGLEVVRPTPAEQEQVDAIIFDELIAGRVRPPSAKAFCEICCRLLDRGAERVLLACTELSMLTATDSWSLDVPVLDSTRIHADAAWEAALDDVAAERLLTRA